jgi:hypothetical protein
MPAYTKDFVFAFGGCSNKLALKSVEKYSINADMWTCLPDMNFARISPTGLIIHDYLYTFGGKNENGLYLKSIERLNLQRLNQAKFEVLDV